MKNEESKPKVKLKSDTRETPILVRDVAQYLTGLARLHDAKKTGNIELSEALLQVANVLRQYGDSPVSELRNVINAKAIRASSTRAALRKSSARRVKMALPTDLESASQSDVEKILDNDDYTKQQISELGFRRFGISKPMLLRLSKEDAKRSVQSALDNERTLDVISKMARRAGQARAS